MVQDEPRSRESGSTLISEEERIYRKVDGTRTVQAIIDATGLGEFEVCRVLFDLINRAWPDPADPDYVVRSLGESIRWSTASSPVQKPRTRYLQRQRYWLKCIGRRGLKPSPST